MARTMVVGLVGLLGVGAIAAASMARSKSPEGPRAAAPAGLERQGDEGRIEREVQALRREVAVLRVARSQELPVPTPSAGTPAPTPPPRGPSAEDLERSRAEYEAAVAALASRVGAEPRDPSWSRPAEQRLSEALRSRTTPGTELVSADCRATLCGVTFRHDGREGQRAVPHLVGAALPYPAEMVYAYSTDGAATTTVYISREGMPLAER
jgi:hypothetical protein